MGDLVPNKEQEQILQTIRGMPYLALKFRFDELVACLEPSGVKFGGLGHPLSCSGSFRQVDSLELLELKALSQCLSWTGYFSLA